MSSSDSLTPKTHP